MVASVSRAPLSQSSEKRTLAGRRVTGSEIGQYKVASAHEGGSQELHLLQPEPEVARELADLAPRERLALDGLGRALVVGDEGFEHAGLEWGKGAAVSLEAR